MRLRVEMGRRGKEREGLSVEKLKRQTITKKGGKAEAASLSEVFQTASYLLEDGESTSS